MKLNFNLIAGAAVASIAFTAAAVSAASGCSVADILLHTATATSYGAGSTFGARYVGDTLGQRIAQQI